MRPLLRVLGEAVPHAVELRREEEREPWHLRPEPPFLDFASGPVEADEAAPPGAPPGAGTWTSRSSPGARRPSSSSMKDLAAFESVAALAGMGVESFKIEGRLKGPDYVAEVVRLTGRRWMRGRRASPSTRPRRAVLLPASTAGFTNGYLEGRGASEEFGGMRGDKRWLEGEPTALASPAPDDRIHPPRAAPRSRDPGGPGVPLRPRPRPGRVPRDRRQGIGGRRVPRPGALRRGGGRQESQEGRRRAPAPSPAAPHRPSLLPEQRSRD